MSCTESADNSHEARKLIRDRLIQGATKKIAELRKTLIFNEGAASQLRMGGDDGDQLQCQVAARDVSLVKANLRRAESFLRSLLAGEVGVHLVVVDVEMENCDDDPFQLGWFPQASVDYTGIAASICTDIGWISWYAPKELPEIGTRIGENGNIIVTKVYAVQ